MTERTYTILLDWDDEVDMYAVSVPALPGCFTQGHTLEEATERAKEAIGVHIAGLLKDGEPIPEESQSAQVITITVAA